MVILQLTSFYGSGRLTARQFREPAFQIRFWGLCLRRRFGPVRLHCAAVNPLRLFVAVGDAALGEIVRRHLQGDAVAGQHADSVAPQFSGQVSENRSVLIQLHTE